MGGATRINPTRLQDGVSFNRRGDSLGGATPQDWYITLSLSQVSIAEAILWGEQPPNTLGSLASSMTVSIAEAILWGEQPRNNSTLCPDCIVSIAEAILWGEQRNIRPDVPRAKCPCFNRRGDSLGGATSDWRRIWLRQSAIVSIAEAILWEHLLLTTLHTTK